jgi:hypothetical protein
LGQRKFDQPNTHLIMVLMKLSFLTQILLDVVLEQTWRSEALQLLAWLVCARRPLEWREIQAAVAIDIEGETVDFYNRQWIVCSKDLCCSLVETRSDGSLELVHSTARL